MTSKTVSKTFTGAIPGYSSRMKTTTTTTQPLPTTPETTTRMHWGTRNAGTPPPPPENVGKGEFTLSVKVTQNMSPSCHMLVHYVRMEEVVADEMKFEALSEFQNKVYFLLMLIFYY